MHFCGKPRRHKFLQAKIHVHEVNTSLARKRGFIIHKQNKCFASSLKNIFINEDVFLTDFVY